VMRRLWIIGPESMLIFTAKPFFANLFALLVKRWWFLGC
jgi:hypothetical protein